MLTVQPTAPNPWVARAISQEKRFKKNFSEITDLINLGVKKGITSFLSKCTYEDENGNIVQSKKEPLHLKNIKDVN
jgi:hypothetical protein